MAGYLAEINAENDRRRRIWKQMQSIVIGLIDEIGKTTTHKDPRFPYYWFIDAATTHDIVAGPHVAIPYKVPGEQTAKFVRVSPHGELITKGLALGAYAYPRVTEADIEPFKRAATASIRRAWNTHH